MLYHLSHPSPHKTSSRESPQNTPLQHQCGGHFKHRTVSYLCPHKTIHTVSLKYNRTTPVRHWCNTSGSVFTPNHLSYLSLHEMIHRVPTEYTSATVVLHQCASLNATPPSSSFCTRDNPQKIHQYTTMRHNTAVLV